MSWKPYGDARVSVARDADANNSETQRPALADCERSSRTWVVVLSRKLLRRAATGFSQRRSMPVHAESLRAQ